MFTSNIQFIYINDVLELLKMFMKTEVHVLAFKRHRYFFEIVLYLNLWQSKICNSHSLNFDFALCR